MFAEETCVSENSSIERIRENLWIKNRHPHVGGIELTPYCNLRCVHCYLQDQEKQTLLSTEEVKHIIDKLFDAGVLFLYFTGEKFLPDQISLKYILMQNKKVLLLSC